MRRKVSISLKLTLIVVLVSAIIIFSLTYINIEEQENFFEKSYSERAVFIAKALDVSIGFHGDLNDTQKLQNFIVNVSEMNPELLQISINVPDEENETLNVLASSNVDLIGSPSSDYNYQSYIRSIQENEDATYFGIIHGGGSHLIMVFTPISSSGEIVGTYEMLFSMDKAYAVFAAQRSILVLISVVSLFILIFCSLYLLRRAIVKPIIAFRNVARLIGGGDLDAKITITSRDELGELADAFNRMATDLKKSRAKIERYNKTLEKLLDQKDEFIGQLGHDLKNPLTPLVGLLPMIEEQEKDPKIKEHLHIIAHNVEYMRDLILKTLQLARLRSPDTKFDFEDLNLLDTVSEIIENQTLILKDNKIKVENKVRDNIFVKADKLRVVELFNNLISNAVNYTPDGGDIIIDALKDNDVVTVSIKDSGIGMTQEQIEQIFDEFYKVDKSRHEMDSSGLGLSICKRIVEKHGGKIWVESPGPGKGSTFYFTLKVSNER